MGRVEDHQNYREVIRRQREKQIVEDLTSVEQSFVEALENLDATQDVEQMVEMSKTVQTFSEAVGEERAKEIAEKLDFLSILEAVWEE